MFDISDLITNFNDLTASFDKIKVTIGNSSPNDFLNHYSMEYNNSYNLIATLTNKIYVQIKQINPLTDKRTKRGLINGIGSIIKLLTGNLDQSDAEKYDRALRTVSDNQSRIKVLMKGQITILEKSISKFINKTRSLIQNQSVLESRIEQLQKIINSTNVRDYQNYHFFLMQLLLSQITTSLQIMCDTLENIEVAITFSKLNTFHSSIIEPEELINEIEVISKYLRNSKLPYEPVSENVITYEKIINIKSFSKNNQIVFVLEVPVVTVESYNYYHLYSLPTPFRNSFNTIIPKNKYLLLSEHKYVLTSKRCKETKIGEYLCQDITPVRIQDHSPCEVQLMKYSRNTTNCHRIPVEIVSTKIERLENDQWIVVTPKSIAVNQECGSQKDDVVLYGSYVIELNSECQIKIGDVYLRSSRNQRKSVRNLWLPDIKLAESGSETNSVSFKPILIDSVNLDDMKTIQNSLEVAKENLNDFSTIQFYNLNFHQLIVYGLFIIVIFIIFYKYRCYHKCNEKLRNTPTKEDNASNNADVSPIVLH